MKKRSVYVCLERTFLQVSAMYFYSVVLFMDMDV